MDPSPLRALPFLAAAFGVLALAGCAATTPPPGSITAADLRTLAARPPVPAAPVTISVSVVSTEGSIDFKPMTRSFGKAARFHSKREVILPTGYSLPEIPDAAIDDPSVFPVTPSHPLAFRQEEIGWTVELTPARERGAGYITLTGSVTHSWIVNERGGLGEGSGPIVTPVGGPLAGGFVMLSENRTDIPVIKSATFSPVIRVIPGKTYRLRLDDEHVLQLRATQD